MDRNTANSIDFLGIGVQKSASSWLWHVLKEHNEIWMPPLKELHYFDRDLSYPSPSFLYSKSLQNRLHGQEPHNKEFRDKLIQVMSQQVNTSDTLVHQWLNKFFFSEYSDKWYCSLFETGAGQLRGEITPSYSILGLQDIQRIKTLFPHLKIIITLRDPVERAWSQARFYMKQNKLGLGCSPQDIKDFIDSPAQSQRSNYSKILENWESCFPVEQIFIGFYSDIIADSSEFIMNICKFLKLDTKGVLQSDTLNKKFNTSPELEIPNSVSLYLETKYFHEREFLINRFGRY